MNGLLYPVQSRIIPCPHGPVNAIPIELTDMAPAPPFKRTQGSASDAHVDIIAGRIRKTVARDHLLQTQLCIILPADISV